MTNIRVGYGFDVHRLVEGRELWIGGIKIEHTLGLLGHSDADVLIHAICDALLGAATLRDIGYNFPDTDMQYKDIDSKILLKRTVDLLASKGWQVVNIDATICAERPKLNPHIPDMQNVMAQVMGIDPDRVSIKATTTEKLGFTGREEGISAHAVALIERIRENLKGIVSETTRFALSLPLLRSGPLPFTSPRAAMVSETIPFKFSVQKGTDPFCIIFTGRGLFPLLSWLLMPGLIRLWGFLPGPSDGSVWMICPSEDSPAELHRRIMILWDIPGAGRLLWGSFQE